MDTVRDGKREEIRDRWMEGGWQRARDRNEREIWKKLGREGGWID
jgi:hypothetical protein